MTRELRVMQRKKNKGKEVSIEPFLNTRLLREAKPGRAIGHVVDNVLGLEEDVAEDAHTKAVESKLAP